MSELRRADSLDLAAYVLASIGPTKHLKLQKLIYYIEAWHLVAFDRPLIADDFEAWLHGPVSRRVWNHYKSASTLYDPIVITAAESRAAKTAIKRVLNLEQLELIGDVLHEYGSKTAYYLESLTHSEEPWRAARVGVGAGESSSKKISKKLMKNFYGQRLSS